MATCPVCLTRYGRDIRVCPSDGSALVGELASYIAQPGVPLLREGPDALSGLTLDGKFKVTRRIGEGGMGVVYQATHVAIGREVAIKIMHQRHAAKPEVAARLLNEARLASSIHHDHIVDVFDVGQYDGRAFFVMELLDGESLAQVIRREGALMEARALEIALQIAGALAAAHGRGVIHRDVKPENVFLVRRAGAEFVKVVDFGISKAVLPEGAEGVEPRLTQTGLVLGTPLYMSPEQARGEDDVDLRIDVYALGVILYECLTGEVPFRGANYLGILSQVLTAEVVPPRQLRPELRISEGAERVVGRAMARERAARYPSMSDLAADLERALRGEPVGGDEVSVAVAPVVPPPQRRVPWLALAAAGALGVAVIGSLVLTGAPPPQAAVMAPLPPPPPPPAPPATVIVKISTTPPGATIFEGARTLGLAPRSVELVRSDSPVRLTFKLDGYVDGEAPIVPKIDGERVEIVLHRKKAPPLRKVRSRPAPPPKVVPPSPDRPPVPDPYRKP